MRRRMCAWLFDMSAGVNEGQTAPAGWRREVNDTQFRGRHNNMAIVITDEDESAWDVLQAENPVLCLLSDDEDVDL
jgi:hypothetical protein